MAPNARGAKASGSRPGCGAAQPEITALKALLTVTVKAPEPEAWALLQGPIAALELDG